MGNWARQARQALSQKEYMRAGDFFKLDGNYRAAVKAYVKGGIFGKAAQIYENLGKPKKAEKLLLKSGTPTELADFHIRQGNPQSAVEIYLKNGMEYDAAELYERLNMTDRAAAIFQKLGFYEKAGVMYGRLNIHDKAIHCLSLAVKQLLALGTPDAKARIQKYQDWIANFCVADNRFQQAAEIFEELAQFEKAAKCYTKAEMFVQAANNYVKVGRRLDAERVLAKSPDPSARAMLGKLAHESGDYQKAVEHLKGTGQYAELAQSHEQLGNYKEAAELFEKASDMQRAGELYAKAGDHQRAALIFEQLGEFDQAAQNYEVQQNFRHAAKLYHMAKQPYKTGFCYYKIGKFEESLEELQRVESIDPNYLDAKNIMARIFFKQGYYSVATKVLEELTSKTTLSDDNLSTYYLLARCLEELQEFKEAARYYERICSHKVTYRDVRNRVEKLNKHLGRSRSNPTFEDSATPTNLQVGDIIADRFRIVSEIGKGGMGFIYKVRDLALDRDVALKMLLSNRGSFEELKTELINARDLTHQYIIKVFDIGEWKGVFYFTMELVEGETLKAYIERSNGGEIEEKLKLLVKICEGLSLAHQKGIIHRDIKPQNILINAEMEPKILDFGIARRVTDEGKNQGISGSPKYMAPEQIQNTGADPRTDIYAIGIIMFYMFTKTEPFTGKDANQILLMQINRPLPDPASVNPTVPYWLTEIIRRCCQKNKDMRYNDMEELINELNLNIMDLNA